MPSFEVEAHTIFVCLAGSQAHGTAGAGSDVDLRGVCVAPLNVRTALFESFDQYEQPLAGNLFRSIEAKLRAHPSTSQAMGIKTESVVFDIAKFLKLCCAANPNALEILFADERDWVHATDAWRQLYQHRERFLTRKVQQTYLGYALAQLKKIQTHRGWLLNPPQRKPQREDFGLPEAGTLGRDDQSRLEQAIADKLRAYSIDTIEMPKETRIAVGQRLQEFQQDVLGVNEAELESHLRAVATRALGIPADVVSALNAEKKYRGAMKHWEAYQAWLTHRNPARAALEAKYGYDTKHAMHLVRLMRSGLELLRDGELRVRRVDAQELIQIREGVWRYEQLLKQTSELQQQVLAAAEQCSLPQDVDQLWVENLLQKLLMATRA